MIRPKLLVLSQTLPYPPDGGVKIRTYHILRLLARHFEVTALCFYRWKQGALKTDVPRSVKALETFATIEAFPIPQEYSRVRLVSDHARSLLGRRVYTVATYASSTFRNRLKQILSRGSFDLVHADSLDLSGYFELLHGLPIVCVHHDVQSALLRRRAEHEHSSAKRIYASMQASLMEKEEKYWAPRVALNVTVSGLDAERLKKLAPGAHVAVVANGVDVEFYQPRSDEGVGGEILFVGGSTWFPNLDGMRFFGERVLPELRSRGIRAPVRWVGRATPKEVEEFREAFGIDMVGYVEDVRPYLAKAACFIVPLRVGGGTRIKILDAWAMGKAVVSTTIGCEGLATSDGVNILVRDDPHAFAEAIARLLKSPGERTELGRQGRATVEALYSWDAIGERMAATYLRLSHGANDG